MKAERQDRSGNLIGDGSWNVDEFIIDFPEFPQVYHTVGKSETTESSYVRYINSENGEDVVVRFSFHDNNAVRFGDQLDGSKATGNEILYRLGLKKRIFIPETYLSISYNQVKKINVDQYEEADFTIQEMYALGAGADLSAYVGKRAKGSQYVITGDKVEELEKLSRNYLGQTVRIGKYEYCDL